MGVRRWILFHSSESDTYLYGHRTVHSHFDSDGQRITCKVRKSDTSDRDKKLREKLQFLNEMEKTGIIRYD